MAEHVSIIIPTYQGAAYILRAVHSVLAQTYPDFEIIVVDDGSTDETKACLQPLIDERKISYFYKQNGGLSDARNFGLAKAQGEYIYFLDSDDWIETSYLEKMMAQAKHTDADIVLSSIMITDGRTETFRSDTFLSQLDDVNVRDFYTPMHFHPIMQNKLFKHAFLQAEAIQFPLGLYYEDVYFFVRAFEKASVVSRCPEAMFYYFQHEDSIMKQTSKKLLDIEVILCVLMKELPYLKNETWFEYYCVRHLFLASTLRTLKSKDRVLQTEIFNAHEQFMHTHFPNWRHNPYLKYRPLYQQRGQYYYTRLITIFDYKRIVRLMKYVI